MAKAIANNHSNRKADRASAIVIPLLLFITALPCAAFAQNGAKDGKTSSAAPKLVVEEFEYRFGKVKEGDEVSHTFKIKNEGAAELIIHNVSPACGCTASDFPKKLAPGEEGKVTLAVKTAGMKGKTERYAEVISNDAAQVGLKLWLHLDVYKGDSSAPGANSANSANSGGSNNMAEKSVLDFTLKNIDGKETKLSDYRGKVLLMVNVASKCGYTPQYEGLQAIYAKYRDQGLVVIGFPANNFGGQEPGTNEEIKQFCTLKYNVSFPMFAKISVKGDDIHPLYKFLTSKETNPEFGGDINWNFNKFLVDRNGKVIARFETREKPEGEKVTQAIEKALK
jgi:glutathione peroxidase